MSNNPALSKIKLGNIPYDLKDADVRNQLYTSALSESGSIVNFISQTTLPITKLIANIEPIQSGSGDPSPDNIRPISGWTGCNVWRTGKNQLGGLPFALAMQDSSYAPQFSIDTVAKTFTFTRGKQTGSSYDNNLFKKLVGGQYTAIITYSNSATNNSLRFVYSDGTTWGIQLDASGNQKTTVVVTSNSSKTLVNIELSYYSTGITTVYYEESGFFPGVLTADQFEPYSGNTYPISWETEAGTVYGGELDVTNGTLIVDRGMIASYNGETLPGDWISDRDVYAPNTTPTVGAQVVYELAESIVYQLAPQQINALLGENNIWADTGDVEVEYQTLGNEIHSNISIIIYTVTLEPEEWTDTTPSTYTYSNTSLKCGKDGTVPLVIDCTSGENEYALIDNAIATAGVGIVFTATTKPTAAIEIRIIDFY